MVNKLFQHRFLLASLWVLLAVVLTACNLGNGGATATPTYDPNCPQGVCIDDQSDVELGPALDIPGLGLQPACPNNYAHPPEQVYPAEGEVVVDLQPEFEWTFDFGCQPLGFQLRIGTIFDPQSDDLFNGDIDELLTTYSGVELLPATWHRWRVYAHLTEGAYVGNGEFVRFLTGPICEADQLVAPDLIYPADGSVYTGKSWGNEYEVEADISYPGGTCLPDSFTIYISETEDFSTPNLNVFSPAMIFSPNDEGIILVEDDSNDVPDCTTLYWKAWASVDGDDGPESETQSFFTNIAGTCLIPLNWLDLLYIVAPQDTNCRASDFSASKNLGTLFMGEQAEVLAVNPEGTHVLIKEPSYKVSCWIWLGLVDLMQGDTPLDPNMLREGVPIQDPPAQPTPTLVPTFTPTPVLPQCSDKIDNDGDGWIDGRDKQCKDPSDNNEAN